jgi:hypothetical protein
MSLKEIKEGWFNFMKSRLDIHCLSVSFKREIENRIRECTKCEYLKVTSTSSKSMFQGKCEKCGCVFPALVYSHSKSCPENKWDSIPDDKLS